MKEYNKIEKWLMTGSHTPEEVIKLFREEIMASIMRADMLAEKDLVATKNPMYQLIKQQIYEKIIALISSDIYMRLTKPHGENQ